MKWNVLKSLNQLYESDRVKKKKSFKKCAEIDFMLNDTEELVETYHELEARPKFRDTFVRYYQEDFRQCSAFLAENRSFISNPSQWDIEDIQSLELIQTMRAPIVENQLTAKQIFSRYFKHGDTKYMKGHPGLREAVRNILGIDEFPGDDRREQQWIDVLQCGENPRIIVLCENIDFLRRPGPPRAHGIELWCAGGSNTAKLQYSNPKIPIYYSCDWDYAGLYDIYKNVKIHIPGIKLLLPIGDGKDIEKTNHKSRWEERKNTAMLDEELFNKQELAIICKLKKCNYWIEEESNDLIEMLRYNNVLP